MPYIISGNGHYISLNKKKNLTLTDDKGKAYQWTTAKKAAGVLNSLPKKLAKLNLYVEQVSKNHEENLDKSNKSTGSENDILKKIEEISEFVQSLEKRRLYLQDMIHTADLKITDIEHAAEFFNLGAAEGYKLYKMLRETRLERRAYKNELEKIDLFLGASVRSESLNNQAKKISNVEKKTYTPRIDPELFGLQGKNKKFQGAKDTAKEENNNGEICSNDELRA